MTPSSPVKPDLTSLESAAILAAGGDWKGARAKGIVLTPESLALRLAQEVIPLDSRKTIRIIDPACGTGRLLVAAAQVAESRGLSVTLHGIELEPSLAQVASALLPSADIRCGDALGELDDTERYDVVLMNPPYRGRLRGGDPAATTRSDRLKQRFGDLLGPYADPSTGFLLLGANLLRPGGRMGAIVPVSIASARDAAGARAHLASAFQTLACWSEPVPFAAQVHTASLVLKKRLADVQEACDWSSRLACASGVPTVALPSNHVKTISDIASATADFRDEYYALKGHLVECADHDDAVALLTCGLVDPCRQLHGQRTARVHGQVWVAPGVRPSADLERLLKDRLVPKVVVATQTGIIESVADPDGCFLPCVPLVRVLPNAADDVWRLAATLLAPQCSALAMHRHFGAGRAPSTLRLRAADIGAMPLIPPGASLDRAIDAVKAAQAGTCPVEDAALACGRAWGPDAATAFAWWRTRLPHRSG